MNVDAYIAVGSNVGDRRATIEAALRDLDGVGGVELGAVSRILETEPVGPPQGRYLNAAAALRTTLGARELLAAMLAIEARHGRRRTERARWGPRTLDLDLLLYADAVIDEPGLTVPHPRLHERMFVLEPLAEIAAEVVHPAQGVTIEWLRRRHPEYGLPAWCSQTGNEP